jgi:hypothetical protein
MNKIVCTWLASISVITLATIAASPLQAQTSEVKEKPPMYSYVADWVIPRAQWGEMAKSFAPDQKILDKALAGGTIIGYGTDETLVHHQDGVTHDDWWSAMSMAGLINVLEQFYQSGNTDTPVLQNATKHWDSIYVSRYYNWHSGSFKNGYTYVASYKLKQHAPDDALDTLSKNVIVPLLEKMLSAGALHEYEIDTQAVHTEAPGTFLIVYIASSPDGLDKVNAAIRDAVKNDPLIGPAFGSLTDVSAHRDELARTNATFK